MKNFINAFFESVQKFPRNTAVVDKHGSYSYTELNSKSNLLAHHIIKKAKEHGIDIPALRLEGKNGIRVAVLLPRTKDFLVAALGVVRSGSAYVPIDAEYPEARIKYIIDDSNALLLITNSEYAKKSYLPEQNIIRIEDIVSAEDNHLSLPEINYSDDKREALLLYTSGSTGKPKGVIHSQRVLPVQYEIHKKKYTPEVNTCCIAAFPFIGSFIDMYPPLMTGAFVYIADEKERKNISDLYDILLLHNIRSMFMPPSLYHAMAKEYGKLPLDFVIVGGKKLRDEGDIFTNMLEMYGSSESAFSIMHWIETKEDCNYIGYIIPEPNISVYILNEEGNAITEPNVPGELCIVSPYLALGYNNMAEQTNKVFTECPFQPGKKMFHTGDIVARDAQGRFIFHGRKDRMIKLRGYRVELDEIESVMQNLPEVKESAAVLINVNNSDKIACYYSLKNKSDQLNPDYIKSDLAEKLPEYMLPEFIVELDQIPFNANGKKDYAALSHLEIKNTSYIPPNTEKEKILCRAFAEILNLSVDTVGINDNFFALGGDSMTAIRLINYLHKENIILTSFELMKIKTLKELAENISFSDTNSAYGEAAQEKFTFELSPESIMQETGWTQREWDDVAADFASRGEKIERIYPLLPLQETMLAVHLADQKSWDYRLVGIYELEHLPTEQQLRNVLDNLAIRHEVLRTAIIYENVSKPVQAIVTRQLGLTMASVEKETDPLSAVKKMREEILTNGFDLQKKPLLNITCAKKSENSCYIILAIHHIITDGWCFNILEQDLNQFLSDELNGAAIKAVRNQPGLYEKAVRELVSKDKKSAENYWKNLISDYEERAVIPHYEAISTEKRSVDNKIVLKLPCAVVSSLTELCRQQQATLIAGLELAWALLLNTYTRLEDVIFAKVVHGRDQTRADLSNAFGLFINTVLVRVKWDKTTTVKQLLQNIRRQEIETKRFEYTPLELAISQNSLRANVYQCLLSMKIYVQEEKEPVIAIKPIIKRQESSNELEASMELIRSGELEIEITYNTSLYSAKTIEQLLKTYKVLLQGIIDNPALPLSQIPRLSEEDKLAVLVLSRGEDLPYDKTKTWVDMFRHQALIQPDHIAVVDSTSSITYGEMEQQSNAIAKYLIQQGVKVNDFVAIKMDRVKEFPVAVLGINKAGAAYVPIDPDYPEERIQYMLEDSQARIVLTEKLVALILDTYTQTIQSYRTTPNNFAYMLYTSGSSGNPKGAIVSQNGLTALAIWSNYLLKRNSRTRHLVYPSFSSDMSIFDIYGPLSAGATVYIADNMLRHDIVALAEYLNQNKINGMLIITQVGMELINQFELNLDYILLGGEVMLPVREVSYRVYNVYGPTECTVVSTYHCANNEKGKIPIGRPVPNYNAFICDNYGNLLPQGIAGELCHTGVQTGSGYWKKPEKTNSAFVDCPFIHGEKMYRTGDLCRYNEDGNLMYLGRLDRQLKIRGFRLELGEIENSASQFNSIEKIAAEVRNKQLCLYYTASKQINKNELKSFLAQSLPEYMVPSVYMHLDSMPMTPIGKIDRKNLPEPEILVEDIVKPAAEAETKVLSLVSQFITAVQFGVTNNLISLGLNSLGFMRLSSALHKDFHKQIPVADMMKHATVRGIAELLLKNNDENGIPQYPEQEFYPLTENQRGIYLDWEQNKNTTQYNFPVLYKFADKNQQVLMEAIKTAFQNHPSLQTRFAFEPEGIVQKFNDEGTIQISLTELNQEPDAAFFQSRIRPFDLFNDTLYRIELYIHKNNIYLFMDFHHTIFDGLSSDILFRDILDAYHGKELPKEEITAYNYALYEQKFLQTDAFTQAEARFDTLLSEANIAVYPHSKHTDEIKVGKAVTKIESLDIEDFCKKHGVTINSYFHAAFGETLYRLTRGQNALYCTVSNGRSADIRLFRTIGMFVQTLPVVHESEGSDSTVSFVRKTHEQLQQTYSMEFYPYTRLIERHNIHAEIMFTCEVGLEYHDAIFEGLSLDTVKFPLSVAVVSQSEDMYTVDIEYDGMLYGERDIKILLEAFVNVSRNLLKTRQVWDIKLLDEEDTLRILALSVGERISYDKTKTWADMFHDQALMQPEHIAVVDSTSSITYAEMDQQSNAIAKYLIQQGVKENDFVAVKMDRVKEFPIAVLGINKAGAAYVPIDPDYPEERIKYMLEDAYAKIILTESLFTDIIKQEQNTDYINKTTPNTLAYMIYTSGSTGKPKGVMTSQKALMNLAAWHNVILKQSPDTKHLAQPSFSFDASITELLCPLTAGATVFIADSSVRRNLNLLAECIIKNEITELDVSPQVGMELINNYDLPVRNFSFGGEKLFPVRATPYNIYNGYGPTEFTVDAIYHRVEPEEEDIPIGRPIPNCFAFLCDNYGNLLPQGATGEIYLAGVQLAEGYWNDPEKTKKAFVDCPFIPGQKMYRTGDLARYNEDGNIMYLGRLDQQIKLRGFRIELGEIENRASQFPSINQIAVEVRQQQLCLYYTAQDHVDKASLQEFMAQTLPEYMVPSVYMQLDAMPMTPSGKIDRKKLPEPEIAVESIILPSSEMEEKIYSLVSQYIPAVQFGITDNLLSLGFNSISFMRITTILYKEFGKQISVSDMMKQATVLGIVKLLSASAKENRIPHYPEQEYYPLTPNQIGIYLDWEQNKNTTQYNIPMFYTFVDKEPLKIIEAVKVAVRNHPVLQTRIASKEREVVQSRKGEQIEVSLTKLSEVPDAAFFQSRIRPFDLFKDILYRFELYQVENNVYFFMDIHHIIFDGLSSDILLGDILNAYDGKILSAEEITSYDYALYEKELAQSGDYAKAEARYDILLKEANVVEYPKSDHPDGGGAIHITAQLPLHEFEEFCRKHNVTVNSYFHAAFGETLYRLTREKNALYCTISNGRSMDLRLSHTVGMFVQTLPVVHTSEGEDSVIDFVQRTHDQLQETYGLEFYPFVKIVDRYLITAEIIFLCQVGDDQTQETIYQDINLDAVKFPLGLAVISQSEEALLVSLEYDGTRYSRQDMENLLQAFLNVAQNMLSVEKIKDIRLVNDEDTRRLLALSKGEDLPCNHAETWVDLFLKQAAVHPDNIAVLDNSSTITYAEMDRQSNSIAAYLLDQNIKENDFVAVKMGRVKEVPVSTLGIFKAGAVYVPIDPDYPEERIKFMLEDSNARIVLTESLFADIIKQYPHAPNINKAKPDNFAYMIYTSGSTGKPKGIINYHRGLRNLTACRNTLFEQNSDNNYLVSPSFSFDAAIATTLCPLAVGACICITNTEQQKDLTLLIKFIEENGIGGADCSMQFAMELVNHYQVDLQYVITGGEKMLPLHKLPCKVYNGYGPSEFTVDATYHCVQPDEEDIPIGRPLPNTSAFVCDPYGNLLPQGTAGELCLQGIQMSAGYWNNPEKTKEAFIDCPFIPGHIMYKTGDLAFYNTNKELQFLGRIDTQVKLRGYRIELGEIENRASKFGSLIKIAAEVRKELLCLYYTAKEQIDKNTLKSFMAQTLPDYMVPFVYMQMDTMPETSSGKIDRKALPEPDLKSAQAPYAPPANEIEEVLVESMEKILDMEPIGIDDNFFTLGGNSISCLKLIGKLNLPGINITMINKGKTARLISKLYKQAQYYSKEQRYSPEENVLALTQELPLLDMQILMLDYQLYSPLSIPSSDLTACLQLDDSIDLPRFINALNNVLQHHPIFSSHLIMNKELEICLKYSPEFYSPVYEERLSEQDFLQIKNNIIKPFEIFNVNLYTYRIITTEKHSYFFYNIHHIIADGFSVNVFRDNLKRSYMGAQLPPDYIYLYIKEQAELKKKDFYAECKDYFEAKYNNTEWSVLPEFDHKSDDNDPGQVITPLTISEALFTELFEKYSITANVFFFAAALLVLAKTTGKQDVYMATTYNGRDSSQQQKMFGLFVREIPVGVSLDNNMSILNLFNMVKELLNEGIARSCYRYTLPNEEIGISEKIIFEYQYNIYADYQSDSILSMQYVPLPQRKGAFGKLLAMELIDNYGEKFLSVTYETNHYERKSMEHFSNNYISVVSKLTDTMDQSLTVGDILS